jgi:hypothetical protein
MPASPIAWMWLVAFILVAWFVYKHWIEPHLPGA